MDLSGRKVATIIGWLLIALEASDLAFVATNRPPIGPHLSTLLILVGPGSVLIWWGRRRPTAEAAARVPSLFWTVVTFVVGALLISYGLAIGLLFSLVTSPGRALQFALVPWGIVGLGLVLLGGYRLSITGSRTRESSEVGSILARIGSSGTTTGNPPSSSGSVPPPLVDLQREIVDAVRNAYQVTSPTIRRVFWTWFVAWTFSLVVSVVLLLPTFGITLDLFGVAPVGPIPLPLAAAVLGLAALGAIESVYGIPARLRALQRAKIELEAGRVPDDWPLMWWIPFLYTARLLSQRLLPPNGAETATQESSVLASSFAFLRFGRRLAWFARYWYTTVFLLLLCGVPTCTFVSVVVVGHAFAPGTGSVPTIFLVAWLAALASLALPFLYLYLRYRRLDPVARQLALLEEAEVQLERTFWSRF